MELIEADLRAVRERGSDISARTDDSVCRDSISATIKVMADKLSTLRRRTYDKKDEMKVGKLIC